MENNSPLFIPKTKKVKGLKIYCNECGTTVDKTCKKTGKDIKRCRFGADHVFKAVAHVPGTDNERRTKVLTGIRDLNEARRLALEFQQEVKDGANSVHVAPRLPQKIQISKPQVADGNLPELMARYIGYLSGDPEIVPAHKRKERSVETIKEMERTFFRFATAMRENDCDLRDVSIHSITEEMIGDFHEYLEDELELGKAGYNRAITNMTSFYNYLVDEGFTQRNPFASISRKSIKVNPVGIKQEQFNALIEIIQKPELGMHTFSTGERKDYYRPWMRDAVELGLYTGRRREEILRMKWKDVSFDSIRVPDYKVNRQKGLKEEDWIYRHIPLTAELKNTLIRISPKDRDPESYILAPEETMNRESMRSFMSKSFAHYYALLGYERRLRFGCLRKTYISGLSAAVGMENAQVISGHSKTQVIKKHYADKEVLAVAAKDFSVYQNEAGSEPENEVKKVRKRGEEKGLNR